jgi:hypothetical protein
VGSNSDPFTLLLTWDTNLVHKTVMLFNHNVLNRRGLSDRLCGLVVRVSGYKSRGPGFDSQPYQNNRQVRGLERGPLSLVITSEELLEKRSSGFDLENRD